MEATTHLFLGVRFNCNKCHDHPVRALDPGPVLPDGRLFRPGRVEARPGLGRPQDRRHRRGRARSRCTRSSATSRRAKSFTTARKPSPHRSSPSPAIIRIAPDATRRQEFAAWLTSADNPYFAKSYVNRLWGYLLGVGIIEPLDDIRAGNPPTNPELLDYLTQEFIDHRFDVRHVLRLICRSRTYQLVDRNQPLERRRQDQLFARHCPAAAGRSALRRHPPRHRARSSRIPGVPAGTRAAALPDSGVDLPDGFLTNLGRPARESACECERSSGSATRPGDGLDQRADRGSRPSPTRTASWRNWSPPRRTTRKLVGEIFLRVLNRPATPQGNRGRPGRAAELARGAQATGRAAPAGRNIGGGGNAGTAETTAGGHCPRQAASWMPTKSRSLRKPRNRIASSSSGSPRPRRRSAQSRSRCRSGWPRGSSRPRQRTAWTPLDPAKLSASNGAQLARPTTSRCWPGGPNGKGTYLFVADAPSCRAVTGLRLEALTDDRLPAKGPGRRSERQLRAFRVSRRVAPLGEPNKKTPVLLQNAQADFSQSDFDVQTAIDGKPRQGLGHPSQDRREPRRPFSKPATMLAPRRVCSPVLLVQQFPRRPAYPRPFPPLGDRLRPGRSACEGLPKNIADILAIAGGQADGTAEGRTAGLLPRTSTAN